MSYIVQGIYRDGSIVHESTYENVAAALKAGRCLMFDFTFEGDVVKIITVDGEEIWNSFEEEAIINGYYNKRICDDVAAKPVGFDPDQYRDSLVNEDYR